MSNILFKKGLMPQPVMGDKRDNENEWFKPQPWQPGELPGYPKGSGFNPVYFANKTNPFTHAEKTTNFALRSERKGKK
jgi:hypothetical protein